MKCLSPKSKCTKHCKCKKCKLYRSTYTRQYRKDNPDFVKRMNLSRTGNGLTLEKWKEMVKACDNKCTACGQEEIGKNQYGVMALAVDHDHTTGAIRDLLCHRCNRALGLLGDSLARLQQLYDYRKKY